MNRKRQELAHESLEFTKALANQYYVKRDLESLPNYMAEEVSLIGTGTHEFIRNLVEAKQVFSKELTEYSGSFTFGEFLFETEPCSDDICIVYGKLLAIPEDSTLSEEKLRLTLILKKTVDGMKLLHLHLSRADYDQQQGHCYVPKSIRSEAHTMRLELDARGRWLENLTKNIPGGAHQCRNDPNFTLLTVSDGFLSMFGYTSEEVRLLFHNHYIEMVCPEDRAAMLKTTQEQLKKGKNIELEYRVLCKNGQSIWILDKGRLLEDGDGSECFYCLLIEITDRKLEQEELRLSLERHQVIMDQATDIIFEWDIRNDTLNFSPNWRKKFGYAPIDSQISGRIPLSQNIYPDDMPIFIKLMQDTATGKPYSETEFRIKSREEQYYWCRIRATTQFDSNHHPVKAIGVIVDIDSEKKQKQVLLDMAQRDPLTGLYNKAAVNSFVEARMMERDSDIYQALFIIDIDYFKAVNDTYGHLAGDGLLSDVAAVLKSHVCSTDVVGRIGGDEFLVYLPEIADMTIARKKAEKLQSALQVLTPERGAPPITCSIGVAVFHHGGEGYYALYKYADLALYHQKNNGRKGVTLYDPKICIEGQYSLPHTAVDGESEGNVVDGQMAQYAFRTLYLATDIKSALRRLLEIIGRSFDVSRAYIFESSEDGQYCSNTFEWCGEGVQSEIEHLQNLSYMEDLDDYQKNFDEDGMFYCADVRETPTNLRAVLEPQGIRSMLQCAILDEGRFVGYVGFDECRTYRAWNPPQVASFKLTADVLSIFLIKLRLNQKIIEWKKTDSVQISKC